MRLRYKQDVNARSLNAIRVWTSPPTLQRVHPPLNLIPFGNSGAVCLEGAYENSPEFRRRDSGETAPSLAGTAEWPCPLASMQPSRRDLNASDPVPGVETPAPHVTSSP